MKNFVNNKIDKTIENIMNYYYSKCSNSYIPALINEGNILDGSTELYVKLMAVDRDVSIDKTWFKENLTNDYDDKCYNIITVLNYKYNDMFVLNPNIFDNNYITMIEPKNNYYMDMEYYGDNKVKPSKVLLQDDKNLHVYFPAIENYSGRENYIPNYDLFIELEYRTYNENIVPDKIGVFKIDNGIVDLVYDENKFSLNKKVEKQYWLRATIKIDIKKLNFDAKKQYFPEIKVVSLDNGILRNLNINNYNDDTNAGLVVFSKEARKIIQKYYYFYDLVLIPKIKNVKECLVDYFDDYIVFWEGEFNSHLPDELKQQLITYNVTNKNQEIISDAMFGWQLGGIWEYYDKLLPNQKLAYKIREYMYNISIENEIDFFPPNNIEEYSLFIKKLFKITNLNVEILNLIEPKKKLLSDIIDLKCEFNNYEELFNNYQGLCVLLLKVLKYE